MSNLVWSLEGGGNTDASGLKTPFSSLKVVPGTKVLGALGGRMALDLILQAGSLKV